MTVDDDRLRSLISAQAAEYFLERRVDGVNSENENDFLQWLRKSPAHVAEYLAIAALVRDLPGAARQLDLSVERLIELQKGSENVIALNPTSADPLHEQDPPSGALATNRRKLWAIAAATCLAAVVVGSIVLWWTTRPDFIATGPQEQRRLQLADNTVVQLNTDSAISVEFSGRMRLIRLIRGEIYCEVAVDRRPFEVRTGEIVIQDIGTAFDIYRQPDRTVVTVVAGQINIGSARNASSANGLTGAVANLRVGEEADISAAGAVKTHEHANIEKAIAWTKGDVIFDGETIAVVAAEFNRYNRTRIVIEDPGVANLIISGFFHVADLNSFAEFLRGLPGVEVTMEGDRMVVRGAKPKLDKAALIGTECLHARI